MPSENNAPRLLSSDCASIWAALAPPAVLDKLARGNISQRSNRELCHENYIELGYHMIDHSTFQIPPHEPKYTFINPNQLPTTPTAQYELVNISGKNSYLVPKNI